MTKYFIPISILVCLEFPSALFADNARLLSPHMDKIQRIVFTKHHELGPYPDRGLLSKAANYAYTEAQSDGPWGGRKILWNPGASLNLLDIDDNFNTEVTVLLDDPTGMIRDPDVSYDGNRVLFAWKKSFLEDDYHLYEMEAATRKVRQLTFGLGFTDFEGAYLPNGDIVFNSTRCVQTVDCNVNVVSNLYLMNGDGKYIRRVGYDQVHTNYPTVTSDGEVFYTRWEYNDRGQIFVQPLFQMYPDGTGQTEVYGNNSWFPTAILHARKIPGTVKAIAVLTGHHTNQRGKLAIIDPSQGRQENSGVTLLAPVRKLQDTIKVDSWGMEGDQWQYPYPLDEDNYLVTFLPKGAPHWAIYFMSRDGERVLLASDPKKSCNQPVPLRPREKPSLISSRVDYTKTTGTFTMEDIYVGPGLKGVERGTVKKLRVVALEYHATSSFGRKTMERWIEDTQNTFNTQAYTPIGTDNVSWDVKKILGETPVYEDGSAGFIVPARTPVYFQAIDGKGYVVQTMRSWSTLQPGEIFSCIGCHEDKNQAVNTGKLSIAMQKGSKPLEPFYNASGKGFSFPQFIQPILDEKCVSCHENDNGIDLRGTKVWDEGARKYWNRSYLELLDNDKFEGNLRISPYITWLSPQSSPPMLRPYEAGSSQSPLMGLLEKGHYGVSMTREELDKIAAWIDLVVPHSGDYTEGMKDVDKTAYSKKLQKRLDWEAQEAKNIQAYIANQTNPTRETVPEFAHPTADFTIQGSDSRWILPIPLEVVISPKKVHIFNTIGRAVRQFRTPGLNVYWDGRDDNGQPLSNGIYIIRVKSTVPSFSGTTLIKLWR